MKIPSVSPAVTPTIALGSFVLALIGWAGLSWVLRWVRTAGKDGASC